MTSPRVVPVWAIAQASDCSELRIASGAGAEPESDPEGHRHFYRIRPEEKERRQHKQTDHAHPESSAEIQKSAAISSSAQIKDIE